MKNFNQHSWSILMIDDDEDDYLITSDMLSLAKHGKHELLWASTYEEGWQMLQRNRFDAALVDYDLGARSGLELIREAGSQGFKTPMILYTGRGSYEVDLQAMQAGAALYLTKGEANPLLLERGIRYAIERKQNEESLRQANQELQHRNRLINETLESIQDGFFALDRDWHYTYINQRAAGNVGFSPEELIGQNIWEKFPKILGTIHEKSYRKAMEERIPVRFETQGVLTERSYDIRVYPSEDGISIYWLDVTERKQMEDHLHHHNVILAGINQIFHEALTCQTEEELGQFCLGVLGQITQSKIGFIGEINNATGLLEVVAVSDLYWEACRMHGFNGNEKKILGSFPIHGIYGRVLLEGIGFYTNDPANHPDRIGTPPGHPALQSFLGVPLIFGGKVMGMIGLGNRDGGYCPEDWEAAEAMAPAIVQAFFRKRTDEVLRAYSERLERSNQELRDFTTIASHDLKEPLRKVQSFGRLLHNQYYSALGAEGQYYLERMVDATIRMEEMLDGLMDYSRISTQNSPFEQVDLAKTAREVLSDLEVHFKQTGGMIELGNLPAIEADPLQMRQLFQNLISNALKFHHPGVSPLIKVWVEDGHDYDVQDDYIELFIQDNGIGFETQQAGKLFQPFNRLVRSTEFDGHGMGLAICRKIVERHGGKIAAHSVPGQGATFVVTLPVTQSTLK